MALAFWGGETLLPGMSPACRAQVYSGHRFGVWAGQLGDGRVYFAGRSNTRRMARPLDWHLKGAGVEHTLMCRGGDIGDGRRRHTFNHTKEMLASEPFLLSGYFPLRAYLSMRDQRYARSARRETGAVLMRLAQSYAFWSFPNISITAVSRKKFSNWLISLFVITGRNGRMSRKNMLCGFEEVAARTPGTYRRVANVPAEPHGVMNTDNMCRFWGGRDYGLWFSH